MKFCSFLPLKKNEVDLSGPCERESSFRQTQRPFSAKLCKTIQDLKTTNYQTLLASLVKFAGFYLKLI